MKTSKEYADMLASISNNVDFAMVDELLRHATANLCYQNTELAILTAKKAKFIQGLQVPNEKGKYPSMASCQAKWNSSDDGQRRIKLKAEVENLKAIIKAVESQAFALRAEARLTANN